MILEKPIENMKNLAYDYLFNPQKHVEKLVHHHYLMAKIVDEDVVSALLSNDAEKKHK